jgi:hypothetical protein
MKTLKKFMFLAVAVFALALSSSCSSDNSSDDTENPGSTEEFIKFKYKENVYSFEPAVLTSLNTNIMGFSGSENTLKRISLWTPNNVTVGSHPIVFDLSKLETTYQATFSFMPEINNASATSGTMIITVNDDKKIEGTFNFSGTSGENTFTVTEGSFRILK